MVEATDLEQLAAQVARITRDLRRLPAQSRTALDASSRVIGDRIARQIDSAAGSVPRPGRTFAVALRRGGIKVQPRRGELQIVIGGSTRSGIGRLTMRQLVWGAEMGAKSRTATYIQRRRRGSVNVTRRVTRQFGRFTADGRFVYPTWRREGPPALDAWAKSIAQVIDDYWTLVGEHA